MLDSVKDVYTIHRKSEKSVGETETVVNMRNFFVNTPGLWVTSYISSFVTFPGSELQYERSLEGSIVFN